MSMESMNPGGASEQERGEREPDELAQIDEVLRLFQQKREERGVDVLNDEKVLAEAAEAMRRDREALEQFRGHAPGSRRNDERDAA